MLPWNKRKNFERNGGLLLECEEDGGRIKQYKAHELKQATNNFSIKNVLGVDAGGQGTVYKGTLKGGTPVTVKLCNRIEPASASAFIAELIIVSNILHPNIVKLLGCCLDTEVPMLVFERLVNGDLAQHLQKDRDDKGGGNFTLSWETRLNVVLQAAEGLSYLHRLAGNVLHGDVKTDNILLDYTFTAKLADFGISESTERSAAGYMDPEYMETGRYTYKSDVYSFGVVLVELLTGKKPVYTYLSKETGELNMVILADYFKELETEQIMGTFLDVRVKHQGKKHDVEAVIAIAKRCLEREGKNRPTMRDVVIELDKIRSKQYEIYAEEIEEPDDDYEALDVDIITTIPLGGQGSQSIDHDAAPTTPRIHQECKPSDPCGPSEATVVADQEMTCHDGQERKASDSVKAKKHPKPTSQYVWAQLVGRRTD